MKSNIITDDIILEKLEKFAEEYDGLDLRCLVGGNSYTPKELVHHIKNKTEVGQQFIGVVVSASLHLLLQIID